MRKLILALVLALFSGSLMSQKTFEKSESFPEFDGWTKLIQLKNGNTGLMEVTKKEGVKFTLFNPARRKITTGKLPLKNLKDNMVTAQVEGVYEIDGDYTAFFITYTNEKRATPVLHRVIVNGTTGKLESEEIVDQITKESLGAGYDKLVVAYDAKGFIVEKDPDSDYYAVIKINTLAPETIDRIEVSHYGPDHKLINKAKYDTPTSKYKYTNFIAAYVHGSEYVLISAYGYNTKRSGGEEARYYVAQLNNGKTTFLQKELLYTEFDDDAYGYFVYNKPKDLLSMVFIITNAQVNQNINPTSMQLGDPYVTDISKANDIFKNRMKRKEDFGGMIQGVFIDSTGNVTYIYQHMVTRTSNYGSSTYLGDIALVTMSPEGREVSSEVFPCSVFRPGARGAFNYNDVNKGRRIYDGVGGIIDNDWYFTMHYFTSGTSNYFFFNNRLENMELPETKEAVRVQGVSGTNGVKYSYQNGAINKEFVFNTPANVKQAKFINPGCSDFNASANALATILTDPVTKTSMVVWTKLD